MFRSLSKAFVASERAKCQVSDKFWFNDYSKHDMIDSCIQLVRVVSEITSIKTWTETETPSSKHVVYNYVDNNWQVHVHRSMTNSRGADRGPRAPPLGLNPMHILLYPRDCSSRKIMLTGKNLGYRVFTSRLFKETQIRHNEKSLGIGVTDFLITL